MRIVDPLSRKKLGRDGFVLVVARNLAQPIEVGESIADAEHRYTVVDIEAAEAPREVQLVVRLMP